MEVRRTPAPGRIVSPQGEVEVESADRGAGHSAGYDLAVVDELGLLGEKHREMVAGMRSSVSARAGRFVSLSIQGVSPLTAEVLERRGAAGLVVHLYEAAEDLPLDDPRAWAAANPGLGSVKSESHMRSEAARVLVSVGDQAFFRAHELNQRCAPAGDMLATVDAWRRCEVKERPPRAGRCVVGLDLGGSSSMTAAVALWESGRVETWAGFPDTPELLERSQTDGAGTVYAVAHNAGELELWPGRVVPAVQFVSRVVRALAGERVIALGADGYRRAEALQAMADGGSRWPFMGRGKSAGGMSSDHAHDVRAAERDIGTAGLAVLPSALLRSALRHTVRRENEYGHPYLAKSRANARIDLVSALVIACGLRALLPAEQPAGEVVVI